MNSIDIYVQKKVNNLRVTIEKLENVKRQYETLVQSLLSNKQAMGKKIDESLESSINDKIDEILSLVNKLDAKISELKQYVAKLDNSDEFEDNEKSR